MRIAAIIPGLALALVTLLPSMPASVRAQATDFAPVTHTISATRERAYVIDRTIAEFEEKLDSLRASVR